MTPMLGVQGTGRVAIGVAGRFAGSFR